MMKSPDIDTEQASAVPAENPGLNRIEIRTIDLFVRTAYLFGVSKSVGEIYGLLFISGAPLSLDEIRTRLQMSSGSASQGLRLLRTVGAVRATYVPGERRDHYVAETNLRKITSGFLREKVEPNLMGNDERLKEISALLEEMPASENRSEIESRVQILNKWRQKAREILPVVVSGLEMES